MPRERALHRALRAAPLRQPDSLSCGASVAVVADMLRTERPVPSPEDFAAQVLHLHRRLTSARDAAGRLQAPWPRWWGTPPWALARHLGVVTGLEHRVHWARRGDRAVAKVGAALAAGHCAPLYVGNAVLPRHVLLALPTPDRDPAGRTWSVYDPAQGRTREQPVAEWMAGRLATGWPAPWAVVVPTHRQV